MGAAPAKTYTTIASPDIARSHVLATSKTRHQKYAFKTYCWTMRCVLKKDPLSAMALRMTST